jgi:ABC-type multidrug transport system ATPase subunit
VLSSHILDDVERVCEYVVVLDRGQVVASQPISVPDEVNADLYVRVMGDSDPFLRRLEALGVEATSAGIEYSPDEIVVRWRGDGALDAIRNAAAESHSSLRLLRPATRSLEDLYIEAVNAQEQEERRPRQRRGILGRRGDAA